MTFHNAMTRQGGIRMPLHLHIWGNLSPNEGIDVCTFLKHCIHHTRIWAFSKIYTNQPNACPTVPISYHIFLYSPLSKKCSITLFVLVLYGPSPCLMVIYPQNKNCMCGYWLHHSPQTLKIQQPAYLVVPHIHCRRCDNVEIVRVSETWRIKNYYNPPVHPQSGRVHG